MDRNTIFGFLLIAGIIIGFSLLNRPSEEEIARQRELNEQRRIEHQERIERETAQREANAALSAIEFEQQESEVDSEEIQARMADAFGAFSASAVGKQEFFTIENERLRVILSSKGGRIYSAELKNFRTHDGQPLMLLTGDESLMNFTMLTNNNRIIHTKDMYFVPVSPIMTDENGSQILILRLKTTEDAHIDFVYTLSSDDYMMNFSLVPHNMSKAIPIGTNSLEMQWASRMRQQERGRRFEERYTRLTYRFAGETGVETMSERRNDSQRITTRISWIAFKGQFFSSILIADDAIISANLESVVEPNNSPFLKSYSADMVVPFDVMNNTPTNFRMFLGPNHYQTLASYDRGVAPDERLFLRKIIPLGWFAFINRFLIIPMFGFFHSFIGNMGIVILLMTLIIRIVLAPLSHKSFMSGAKMRVLKPEIDEINEKIPADKPVERQQATMKLYSKMGVSPMSGCLPMLIQMPFLISMFWFFPTAIELRQASFLWATDLSTYDAIISWNAQIPLISNLLGNHISLFCLLMAITTFLMQKLNPATQGAAMGGDQMKMMKMMMNFMPIMLFFFLNSYAAGLTYYYFLSNLFTAGQTYITRAMIDDEKLLAELRAKSKSKKDDPKKKPSFMERLEKMQREQQKAMQQRNKKR